jgi:hypothetical protein
MRTDYVPGDGLAVVVDGTVALLPEGCAPELLDALWASMLSGGPLTDHLQVLLGPGLVAAPAFAIVRLTDGAAHVVVRGSAQATLTADGRTVTIGAAHVSTWAEDLLPAVEEVRLTSGVPNGGRPLPVHAAVVPAAEVRLAVTAGAQAGPPAPEPEPEPETETTVGRPTVGVLPTAPVPAPEPAPAAVEPATARTVVHDESFEDDEEDVVAAGVPAWEPVRPLRTDHLSGRAPVTGRAASTALDAPAAAPAPAPAPAPAVPPSREPEPDRRAQEAPLPDQHRSTEDHDGLTVLSSDMVALRRQLPDWAGDAVPQLSVPTPHTRAPAKLLMSTGLVVSLNRPVLIGRSPQVTRVPGNEIPRLITVASPNQDISRTHCEVRMDGDDVVVTDLRSTNGVLLLRQGAGAQRLHPGEPTVVEPGVVVDLGEGVTFLVEAGG